MLRDWLGERYTPSELGPDLDTRLEAAVTETEDRGLTSRRDVYLYAELTLVHGFVLRDDPVLKRICQDENASPDTRMLAFVAAQPAEFWQASRLFAERMKRL